MKKVISLTLMFFALLLSFCISAEASEVRQSKTVSSLKIESYPEKTVYGAFEKFDPKGLSLSALYTDGTKENINPEDVKTSYRQDVCFRVGDEYILLSYGGKSLRLPITVNPIEYDLSEYLPSNASIIYNGKYQEYTELLPSIVGLDGISLNMTAVGGGTNAGEYDISIDFSTASKDYLAPESLVIKMIIEPYPAEVRWGEASFVYDGRSKVPTANFVDVGGRSVSLSVIGAATNAGQGYTARVANSDPNYVLSNTSISFEIKKADYDLSSVSWSADSFIYDGSNRSVTLSGLPKGISVVSYSGDIGRDAGKYTASCALRWDEANYNPPKGLIHKWEILPADYDLSGVDFESASYVFDGQMHYPSVRGSMPVGQDGIALQYSFSTGATHVDDGRVSVAIIFHTDSKNYKTPETRYSSVMITPRGIEVKWGSDTIEYSGERQAPLASADECNIKVSGGGLTVGKYSAKAESTNSDFFVLNAEKAFSIVKAKNLWLTSPSTATCYEGKEIKLRGDSRFGEISYTFYSDAEGKNRISPPTSPGRYYAVMTVADTVNYSGLTSEVISFEIVEIVAVSLVGSIRRDRLCAFDTIIAEDIICSVVNNDGSAEEIDSKDVKIYYQNGSSLRKNDEYITLKYKDFVLKLEIAVDYADYDLSELVWVNTITTYNGKRQSPMLDGLPDGVQVIGYVGADVTDAGSYTVTPIIDYDEENYNEPIIPPCTFVIEKQRINIPFLKGVYNGSPQKAKSDSLLYLVTSRDEFTNAGLYSVSLKLLDQSNYLFAETMTDTANALFEILPANLSVSVSDVRLHLFEKLSNASYVITSGTVYNNDRLSMSFVDEGGKITAISDNPNYTISAEPGRLIRLPYPTLSGGIIILCYTLALIAFMFLSVLAFRKRRRLIEAAAVIKCRWHNRSFHVAPPRSLRASTYEPIAEEPIREERGDSVSEEEDKLSNESFDNTDIPTEPIDEGRADMLITDQLAKSLLKKDGDVIYTEGSDRAVIGVGVLSESFMPGERVDANSLKNKGLISEDTAYLKITSEGKIDKPLTVFAGEFSLSAIKMIALSGGQAIKCVTLKGKPKDEKE